MEHMNQGIPIEKQLVFRFEKCLAFYKVATPHSFHPKLLATI
jgi:hypothetical protein